MAKTARDWALELAARGLPVFPLQPGSKEAYVTKHKDPTKICRPADRWLAGGIHIATTDATKINKWFEARPDLNYGVSMTRLVGLDVDAAFGKPGMASLANLGELPRTFTVASPRGGLHIYFQGPGAGQTDLAPGINIRSIGGYLVGPGSVFEGRPYTVTVDAPLAELPAPIRARLGAPGERLQAAQAVIGPLDTPQAKDLAYAFVVTTPGAPQGERGSAAYKLAARMKDFGISQETALDFLADFWAPRCDPPAPLEVFEAEVAHAYEYGKLSPGCDNPALEFEALPPELFEPSQAVRNQGAEGVKASSGNFKFLEILAGPESLPPRPWVVPDFLMRGGLTGLIAAPGAGKSTFSLALAIGLALGRLDWLGFPHNLEPQKIVLINNEDDDKEIRRRVYAICIHNGLDWSKLHQMLIIHNPKGGEPFTAFERDPASRRLRATSRLLELENVMAQSGAAGFIADPTAEMHEGDENNNGEVAQVMKGFRALARRFEAFGLMVHHTRKPPLSGSENFAGDPASARGAGAFWGNVRAMATLYAMSKEDAERYQIKESERFRYARLDVGKGSYSPPGAATRWFYTSTIHLDNGDSAPAVHNVPLKVDTHLIANELHALLAGEALQSEDKVLPLKLAARIAKKEGDLYSKLSEADIKRQIAEVFTQASVVNGVGLVLEGRGASRRLKAWEE